MSMVKTITEIEKIRIRLSTSEEIISILNRGHNGHPEFWLEAQREANRRKVYFIQNIIRLEDKASFFISYQ